MCSGVVLILCALTLPVWAGSGAFTGKWRLDPKKSHTAGAETADETLSITVTGEDFSLVRARGGLAVDLTVHARFDDKVYGVFNSNAVDAVKCWLRDPRTIEAQFFKSASVVEWVTLEVSKDGKTLRWTVSATDAKGKEAKSQLVFERE